jgi:hypothetical protein
MIYIGLYTFLPPANIYYAPPHLREQTVKHTLTNPPFNVDVLSAPTAPSKTLPATVIIERLKQVPE